jgi:hypothetical protein
MQVGDSKFYSSENETWGTRTLMIKLGWRYTTRRVMESGVKGWRIWRTG